ncbi:toll/interleukin-1 receptor domain-containing protein [Priestia filamentosa]|uniref:toll/interleukin-1 receptor domain-containing protein n=1 Tax=Priestia filamentosa TaxID=1402861 RepID=UPI00397B289D
MELQDIQSILDELEHANFDMINPLNSVLRIAQYRLDIEEILFCKLNKARVTMENNKAIYEEVREFAIKKGLTRGEYKNLYKKVYLALIEIRKCDTWHDGNDFLKDQSIINSVSEMMLDLKHHEHLLENNKVPTGLGQFDAYAANESKKNIDNIIYNRIINYKTILNKIKDHLIDYLLKLESKLLHVRETEILGVKEQLELLIKEGYQVKDKCFDPNHEDDGIYANISGVEYVAWLEKGKMFIKNNINDPELYRRFSTKADSANNNDPQYFDELIGILTSLLSTDLSKPHPLQKDKIDKIFISHSSQDIDYVTAIVDLLNDIGIKKSDKHIFCSSLTGYDIPYGKSIYDFLKQELNNNSTMVLFVLSHNYYESAPCLNEMGAAWITSKEYNSILTPNFDFKKITGAIDPTKISFYMNDEDGLNKFKDQIVNIFNLENIDYKIWERDRRKFIEKVNTLGKEEASTLNAQVQIERVKKGKENELELQLRFINVTDIDIEFKYIDINLVDGNGNEIKLSAEDEYLEKFKLYNKENKVVKWTFKHDGQTNYNPRRDIKDSSKVSFEIY